MSKLQPSSRPITVSIVSHGQQALILPLLSQLDQYCAASIERVVITVNILEPAQWGGPWSFPVTVIENVRARGFGANHNSAFAHCASPWFLVLNPDIRLEADTLQSLLVNAQAEHGIVTPRILEPGNQLPEPHRRMLTPWELLLRRTPNYKSPSRPDWIPGLFMLLRAEAFRAVNGFDERFFMYGEDFDLSARLRLRGWHILVDEQHTVVHAAQRASRRSARHLRWHLASLARVWTSRAFWRYWVIERARSR